ncbi:MAG TPA: LysR substrate-binding domain-containing protein [Ideonella sp.]|uniref:LysR family transcriptional regulator n=1 Tax=Ideonella sp. TaxID=1929293 RepID=UPI002B985DDF|nr:LysR substrate-binding domain-containing protein [Ideonella sp.]HSI51666.1 LysR substrate-binding domain-containing protein [Ideonella sp.]
MESLANLESFVRAAESRSFSEAGRRLGLTAAAISRNVAMLERNLGVRLFHRTTRKLALTEVGERFLDSIHGNLEGLQVAIAQASAQSNEPAGVLKVSMSPTVGLKHILPLLPPFLAEYPRIRPEWHFENRPVDLIAENYDAAIGGGFDLAPGFVSRTLAPVHIVAVASPVYMAGRTPPADPSELAAYSGIVMRAQGTGRVRQWMFRNVDGVEMAGTLDENVVMDDPAAMREAARLGLGISLIALFDVLPELERGELIRLLPDWYAEAGAISIYYASRRLVSAKTRVFVDCVVNGFKSKQLDVAFSAKHS